MSAVSHLDVQNYCPVCGGARLGSSGQPETPARGRSVKVFFACGAAFASFGDAPIEALEACPAPSAVAVLMLNAEVAA